MECLVVKLLKLFKLEKSYLNFFEKKKNKHTGNKKKKNTYTQTPTHPRANTPHQHPEPHTHTDTHWPTHKHTVTCTFLFYYLCVFSFFNSVFFLHGPFLSKVEKSFKSKPCTTPTRSFQFLVFSFSFLEIMLRITKIASCTFFVWLTSSGCAGSVLRTIPDSITSFPLASEPHHDCRIFISEKHPSWRGCSPRVRSRWCRFSHTPTACFTTGGCFLGGATLSCAITSSTLRWSFADTFWNLLLYCFLWRCQHLSVFRHFFAHCCPHVFPFSFAWFLELVSDGANVWLGSSDVTRPSLLPNSFPVLVRLIVPCKAQEATEPSHAKPTSISRMPPMSLGFGVGQPPSQTQTSQKKTKKKKQ